ncbi:MAG: GNAT family N-acetyltransferase [Gammaproteobacteria bacterium]
MDLVIAPFSKKHDRKNFDCGEFSLNQYLDRYANQDIRRRVSRVFVASPPGEPRRVIGYCSLSASSLTAAALPEGFRRWLPKYPVPVALLGRLAIDKSHRGKGIGAILIADALQRVALASQMIAVYAVVVDALNDGAADFYLQFGFIRLPGKSLKLFLPMKTISRMVD